MLIPKLRFPEFTDEWCEKSLSNYATKIIKKNTGNIIDNVISNSAKNGLIFQRDFFDKDIADKNNTAGYYVINQNDFVYNPRKSAEAPYGPVNIYKFKETGIVSPLYLCFKINNNVNYDYLLNFFKSSKWHNYVYFNGDSGARFDRVSIKDELFLKLPLIIPSINEQNKISNFLSILDKKIELQSKKIEALKLYSESAKKVLFNDSKNWNYKKISEVLDYEQPDKYIVKGTEYNDNYVTPVLTANKGFILGYTNETKGIYDKETIIFDDFTMDYKYVNFPFKIKSSAIKLLTSKEINLRFIAESLNNLNLVSTEHKRHYITFVQDLELPIPSKIIQDKIATILKCFDKKINNENKYLLELEILKKGLMQNMFV